MLVLVVRSLLGQTAQKHVAAKIPGNREGGGGGSSCDAGSPRQTPRLHFPMDAARAYLFSLSTVRMTRAIPRGGAKDGTKEREDPEPGPLPYREHPCKEPPSPFPSCTYRFPVRTVHVRAQGEGGDGLSRCLLLMSDTTTLLPLWLPCPPFVSRLQTEGCLRECMRVCVCEMDGCASQRLSPGSKGKKRPIAGRPWSAAMFHATTGTYRVPLSLPVCCLYLCYTRGRAHCTPSAWLLCASRPSLARPL